MDLGFIKVAAVNMPSKVADCTENAINIIKKIKKADENKVKLAVFPELCLSGKTCGDLFFDNALLTVAEKEMQNIIDATADTDVISVIGAPVKYNSAIYNCACVIYKGDVLGVVPKTYLSLNEKRWFSVLGEKDTIIYADRETLLGSGAIFASDALSEFSFGVEIGSDILGAYPLSAKMAASGANIIAHAASKEETTETGSLYKNAIIAASQKYNMAYISSFAGGESTTDCVYAGGGIIAENGDILCETKPFDEKDCISEADVFALSYYKSKNDYLRDAFKCEINVAFDMEISKTELTRKFSRFPFTPETKEELDNILNTQSAALAKRITHTFAKKAVIGISGGLDSCLALIVCVRAMQMAGKSAKDVVAVTMPCFGTSKRTRTNAEILTEYLGAEFKEVDITNTVKAHLADIGHDLEDHSVVYENAQARARTYVLMDLANKLEGFVVGTGDMSELALGWATYNGDHMSMYGVNAGVTKTLIREIVARVAEKSDEKLKAVLLDILGTPISPELLPLKEGEMAQITEDIVGPYELHDFILHAYLKKGCSPKKIFEIMKYVFDDYKEDELKKWIKNFFKRFFSQQFKRSCLPDGVKVLGISLSPRGDLVMPSDAAAKIWLTEAENL